LSYLSVSSDLPASVLNRLRANSVVVQNPQNIDKPISQSSSVDEIKELQTALTTLGYYSGPVTGNFGPLTKEAVLYFQLSEGIVDSPDSVGAGTYGPKTRTTLTAKLETHNEVLVSEKERLMENFEVLAVGLGKNSTGDDVVNLQRMLWELGYYRGSLTGEYDEATMEAVFNFQQKEGILDSEWERGAGYFGKKTYAAMEEAIEEKAKRIAAYPMQAQTWVPAARPLPKIASLSVPEIAFEKQSIVFSADLLNKNVVQTVALERTLDLNDRNEDVIKLQNILIEGGYLAAGLNTGYYGEKTQQAVLRFQMEQGIVSAATDSGAGRVGPRTLEALNHV
ncbi:MAG: peptidoglycan-binding protein, partial [Candidatus Peregrinibacteria bacterium]|nr:peptidoglycan-binding protein [Candidatus Peregrinibacteria bacterium]